MFDVRLLRDVSVISAAGVGGGSLVYANVQLRAPAEVFEDGWPAAITRAGLDPWYDWTEAALEPRSRRRPTRAAETARVRGGGAHAGREAEPLPIAVHFGASASTRSAASARAVREPRAL